MYSISELREWVDKAILTLAVSKEPEELYAPVSYMMSIGGKRLRPVLCLLSCNMFTDLIDNDVLLPAVGIEIFHTFTLVHDDIMDNAPARRNQPTVHQKWNTNVAILSGDVMCIEAYQYLCQANPVYQAKILRLFNRTAAQVCEGQQYDMNYEGRPVICEDEYLQMIELKTAVLIACAAEMGAIAGGATSEDTAKMYEFGRMLGLAFQIQDDLLDAYGDATVFGKCIGNDIASNKKTFLLQLAMQQATGDDRKKLQALLTDKTIAVEEKIKKVLDIYQHLQIRQQAEKRIADYFDKALALLGTIEVEAERKQYIQEFSTTLIGRDK